jgi:hypothetical protein
MAATAMADIASNRTPVASVDVWPLSPEKYDVSSALPMANVAVADRNSTPTSTAVFRYDPKKGLRTAVAVALICSSLNEVTFQRGNESLARSRARPLA